MKSFPLSSDTKSTTKSLPKLIINIEKIPSTAATLVRGACGAAVFKYGDAKKCVANSVKPCQLRPFKSKQTVNRRKESFLSGTLMQSKLHPIPLSSICIKITGFPMLFEETSYVRGSQTNTRDSKSVNISFTHNAGGAIKTTRRLH